MAHASSEEKVTLKKPRFSPHFCGKFWVSKEMQMQLLLPDSLFFPLRPTCTFVRCNLPPLRYSLGGGSIPQMGAGGKFANSCVGRSRCNSDRGTEWGHLHRQINVYLVCMQYSNRRKRSGNADFFYSTEKGITNVVIE